MSVHARVAPSKLALTIACPGSLQLQEKVAACPPTEEELEGDAGHLVAAAHALGHGALWGRGHQFAMPQRSGDRVWTVDDDMFEGAQMWLRAMGGYSTYLRVEEGVSCERISPECFGTPDGFRAFKPGEYVSSIGDSWTPPSTHWVIRLGDYKFGHRYVDEFENWQLIAYMCGVLEQLRLHDQDVYVEFVIVQPRCFSAEPIRIWRERADRLRHRVNQAFNEAARALQDEPPTQTGPHCLDCSARHLCTTLRHASTAIVSFAGTGAESVANVDPLSLGQELAMLDDAMKQLEARKTGLHATVEAIVRAGVAVPHYGLQPTRSNRQWKSDLPPEQIHAVMGLFGIDIAKPFAVKTPTQVIDDGVDETIVMEYAHRPPARLALKRDKANAARKIFTNAQTAKSR